MPRLLRPAIPLDVRCLVAMRQLGEMWPNSVLDAHKRGHGRLLRTLLASLAEQLGCEPGDLQLDHDPALGVREKVFRDGVHVDYVPPANDPGALIYREKTAHGIKTRVRGERGQFSDLTLIKRQRRRERPRPAKPKARLKTKGFAKIKNKSNWPKRPFQNRRKP